MLNYILRRLLLIPITLFFIILVTFVIINLAPGDPVTLTEISPEGMAQRKEGQSFAFGSDARYLQFREHYGLTLPVLINLWPFTSLESVKEALWSLVHRKESPDSTEMSVKEYDALRIGFGDKAKFIMPLLVKVMNDPRSSDDIKRMAVRFFVRGATRQAYLGGDLQPWQRAYNRKISNDQIFLNNQIVSSTDTARETSEKIERLNVWYGKNKTYYRMDPAFNQKLLLLFETRFVRYFSRVATLDFGTLRNDSSKTVISEVARRFKYSLTLSILPMILSFGLCQVFGFAMAYNQNRFPDYSLNVLFLILFAIPIFVAAPFLIEKIALHHDFPFTKIPIPISGFTSPEGIYSQMTSKERLFDVLRHIFLPISAIMYGTLAASSRLSRTAVLEVMRQDYVRTARAKGVGPGSILGKHIGRNAGITIITSIAGSLGIVLGGSLIVETLFEINGFGKFFYDAVINRDYNVIMFSAIAGSFLALLGYLAADISYTFLDPRVTLE